MKKVLIGCLAVFLLIAVAGSVAGYLFVVRPARTYLASFAQIAEIAELDRQVQNTRAFQPPEGGELTAEKVERFAQVQRSMKGRLGERLEALDAKYETLNRQLGESGRNVRVSEVLGAYRDVLGVVVEAKRAQVDGLNEAGFSVAEYAWVREQVYQAAGMNLLGLDLDALQRAAESGDDGGRVELTGLAEAPEKNRELVAPYEDEMEDWIILGFFGL
jgi:hypothetical protein